MQTRNPELDDLAARTGIVFDHALDFLPRHTGKNGEYGGIDSMALDSLMAQDAPYNQQTLITSPDSGIPAFLTTFVDPKLIEVLLTPLKAEQVYGVSKKGDWTTQTAMFVLVENTGVAATYNDFGENGRSDINPNFVQRQSINFQTFTEWGDLQLERMALARIDQAARLNIASANTLAREMNLIYFYGMSGLQCYGGLNDPSLNAALTPATKAASGTSWAVATPTEIIADIQAGYAALVGQTVGTGGNIELDSPLTLALSPISETYLVTPNSFGLNAMTLLKTTFPNLKVVTAVQYLSGSTYSYQLIADSIEGQETAQCAFNEKMRAHRIIPATSSFKQKKSAGCWGTVIFRPAGIATMSGI